jgi:hypothetical protein
MADQYAVLLTAEQWKIVTDSVESMENIGPRAVRTRLTEMWNLGRGQLLCEERVALEMKRRFPTPPPTCATCRFQDPRWSQEPERFDGVCRRQPPTSAGFPMVTPRDWCGEHQPKEPK